MIDFLPFIIFLMILAVFLRAEPALTIFYMVIGAFILAFWWSKRAIKHIQISRSFIDHAFLGDEITVELKITNTSILPILWLEIHESLPVNLRAGRNIKQVFSLGIREEKIIRYSLYAFKRGYYVVGPLSISTGDPLGLIQPTTREFAENALIIYPRIVDLTSLGLPSRSPFGTLKHHDPIFEDPSRLMGKRAFKPGDAFKRIDWKATASSGKLQTKLYEASIALDVVIILDLNHESYPMKTYYDATELAVTASASIAAWGNQHGQSIGLLTNAVDPQTDNALPNPMMPRKGTGHFISMLEILARIRPGHTLSSERLIQNALAELSWGTTMVFISGSIQQESLGYLFQARKRGINPVIILTAHTANDSQMRALAKHYHIPHLAATYPQDLQSFTRN